MTRRLGIYSFTFDEPRPATGEVAVRTTASGPRPSPRNTIASDHGIEGVGDNVRRASRERELLLLDYAAPSESPRRFTWMQVALLALALPGLAAPFANFTWKVSPLDVVKEFPD